MLASGRAQDGGTNALPLHADAAVLAGSLRKGQSVRIGLAPGRSAYVVPATGRLTVNGAQVATRDGAAITGETDVAIIATEDTELVMVDVAGT